VRSKRAMDAGVLFYHRSIEVHTTKKNIVSMISILWKIFKTQSKRVRELAVRFFDSVCFSNEQGLNAHICKLTEEYERVILTLFNHPILATALIRLDGIVIRCNHRFYQLLGIREHETVQIRDFLYLEDQLIDAHIQQKLIDGAIEFYTVEKQFINRDNEMVWVNLSVSLVKLPVDTNEHQQYLAVLFEDITENKKIYSALVRTEEKWKTFVLNSLNLFIQTSSTGQIIYSSPAVERILGYQEEELLDLYIWKLIHPHDLNQFDRALGRWLCETGYNKAGVECRWKTKSGLWVCLYAQGQRFPLSSEVDGLIIDGYDITDRKLLEAELKASEKKFNSLVHNIPGAAFQCDMAHTMRFVSDEIQNLTGYPASEFIGNRVRSYLSIIHLDDVALIRSSMFQNRLENYADSIEYRIIHADGGIRWISERRRRVFSASGKLSWFDGILFDISDRKRTEEDLCRSEALNRAMFRVLPDLLARRG